MPVVVVRVESTGKGDNVTVKVREVEDLVQVYTELWLQLREITVRGECRVVHYYRPGDALIVLLCMDRTLKYRLCHV